MNYDPMNYVSQPGNAIAQMSSAIGNTIQSIPGILKQNKEYQLLQQKLQSEEKIAESAYTGMNSLLLDMGANKKVRAPNQGEATDDYLKYIAQEVSSLATDENGGLSPQKLQQLQQRASQIGLGQDAGVKESIAKQGQINKYDPMSTIQLNKDTVQPESMPLRAQIGEGDIGRTPMTGRSSSFDPITGVGVDVETGTVNTPAPVQKKYDPLEDVEASLLSALKNGDISASKFAEQKLNIATARGKMNYTEGQDADQRGRDTNEANAKDVIAGIGKHEILKDGVVVSTPNPSDIRANPYAYSLGKALLDPNKKVAGTKDNSQTQADREQGKSLEQYNKVNADIARLYSGKDEFGEPLVFASDPIENKKMIAKAYEQKRAEASTHLLAHYLQVNGSSYNDAQSMVMGVVDIPVAMEVGNNSMTINDAEGKWIGLNMAHPQVKKDLLITAQRGETASSLLKTYKKLRGIPK